MHQRGFKVRIEGIGAHMNEDNEDVIEEDIQTDRDEQNNQMKNIGNGLTESGGNYGTGITVS